MLGIFIFELMTGQPPFASKTPLETHKKINRGIEKVEFPETCKGVIEDLVKDLCKKEPSERLPMRLGGTANLKSHAWLESFDWEGLANHTSTPPYVPKLASP